MRSDSQCLVFLRFFFKVTAPEIQQWVCHLKSDLAFTLQTLPSSWQPVDGCVCVLSTCESPTERCSIQMCASFLVLSVPVDRESDLLSLTSLVEEHTRIRRYHTFRIPNTLALVTSPVSDMLRQTHSSLFLINVTLFCSLSLCEEEDSGIDYNSVSFAGSHQVMSLLWYYSLLKTL